METSSKCKRERNKLTYTYTQNSGVSIGTVEIADRPLKTDTRMEKSGLDAGDHSPKPSFEQLHVALQDGL